MKEIKKKRFPWFRCFLFGLGMAAFIACGLTVVNPLTVGTNLTGYVEETICHFLGNIVVYTLVAAFFTWIYKATRKLFTRTDFIDYHPEDDKKDKEG